MKTKILLTNALLFFAMVSWGQNKDTILYKRVDNIDIRLKKIEPTKNIKGKYTTIGFFNEEVNENNLIHFLNINIDSNLTSAATLNSFFAIKTSTYLSEASDLSLSKAYAVLDNSDGRLFIGGTINKKQSTTEFARFLFTGGIKANVKDGFANLFSAKSFNNDIGLSLKATIFGRGSIWFDKEYSSQKEKTALKRRHLANELLNNFDAELNKFRRNATNLADSAETVTSFAEDYSEQMKEEFAQKEAEYIIKHNMYNVSHNWWIGFDIYVPVTKTTYNSVNKFTDINVKENNFRPYEFNFTYTNFWDKNIWNKNPFLWRGTTLLTFKASLLANNSVNASLINPYSFEQYLMRNSILDTLSLAQLESKSIYVGDFERFITPKISGKLVYMPVQYIGLSAAIEKSFGKVNDLNWRLGVPFSFKDNDGKSKINFELVWREVSKEHSVGVSVGLPIGSSIF